MNPEQVLNEEERNQRFKLSLSRKKQKKDNSVSNVNNYTTLQQTNFSAPKKKCQFEIPMQGSTAVVLSNETLTSSASLRPIVTVSPMSHLKVSEMVNSSSPISTILTSSPTTVRTVSKRQESPTAAESVTPIPNNPNLLLYPPQYQTGTHTMMMAKQRENISTEDTLASVGRAGVIVSKAFETVSVGTQCGDSSGPGISVIKKVEQKHGCDFKFVTDENFAMDTEDDIEVLEVKTDEVNVYINEDMVPDLVKEKHDIQNIPTSVNIKDDSIDVINDDDIEHIRFIQDDNDMVQIENIGKNDEEIAESQMILKYLHKKFRKVNLTGKRKRSFDDDSDENILTITPMNLLSENRSASLYFIQNLKFTF